MKLQLVYDCMLKLHETGLMRHVRSTGNRDSENISHV